MRIKILHTFVILLFTLSLAGQQRTIDSLEALLSQSGRDTNRIEILNQLSYYYLYSDSAKVKSFDRQSLELSKELKYDRGIALSYVSMGNTYFSLAEYDKALEYYYLGLEIARKNQFNKIILGSQNGIACIYYAEDEMEKAKQIYLQQLDAFGQVIDKSTLFDYTNNLAACYARLNSLDSALYYYDRALKLAGEIKSPEKMILANINLSKTYMRKDDPATALSILEPALTLARERDKSHYIALINLQISEIYYSLGDYQKALQYCQTSLSVSSENNYPEVRLSGLKVLADIYLQMNDPEKVFNTFSSYISLKDSISNDQKDRIIAELNTRYETAKKEDAILKLNENLQNKRKMLFLVISLSVFLVATLSMVLVILNLRRKNLAREKILKQQEKQILEQELELKINIEKELQRELENKKNEIKNNLLSLIKLKMQRESLMEDFEKIKDHLKPDGLQIFKSISMHHKIDSIQMKISEFETNFEEINKGFYEKLLSLHPDLTANEKKLCTYITMGMSAAEISELTFQSENSIYVSRNRLKKKLNPGELSLEEYLSRILSSL